MWTVHEIYISYRIVCSLSFSFSYDLSLCSSATSILQLGGRTCDLCIYKFFISFFFAHNFWALCAFVRFLFCVYYDYMTTIETFAWAHATTYLRQIYWGIFYNKFVIFVCILHLIDWLNPDDLYAPILYSTITPLQHNMNGFYISIQISCCIFNETYTSSVWCHWMDCEKWGKLLTSRLV